MNQSYPAFVSFHSLSNCFAYAKLLTAINNANDLSSANEKFGGPLLGNFRMKSCDNPNIYCDIQVFGQFPFTNVFINSVFAEVSGFHEKQEVILEKMESKTYCSHIEVAPRTEDDYSVIAQSQSSIENEFLNQIRLVSQNMIIPHFLSPGVYVQFRILNIVPASNKPVMLNNDTELHVQTVTEGSQNDEKATMAQKVSNIVQDLSMQGFLSNYVINLEKTPIIGRVLPKKTVELWVKSGLEKLDKSTIYIPGKESCLYSEHGIVEIRSQGRGENEERFQFFYLHRSPNIYLRNQSNELDASLSHMFESLQLENRCHCVEGTNTLEPYMNIKIFGVTQNRICTLRYCEIMMEKETFQWVKEFELTNVLTKSLHSELQGNPILLSVEGKELDVAVDDKAIRLKVVPSMKGLVKRVTENTCFLFDLTTELIFQQLGDLKQKHGDTENTRRRRKRTEEAEASEQIPQKPETSTMENFGFAQNKHFVQIGSHSKLLSELDKVCCGGKQHVMVLGGNGSGKTTFIKKLARRLSHNSSVTFCKMVPCALLKGRSADIIEKLLSDTLHEMEVKKPSCLFLDDFDVILPQIDQEQRHLAMEKVVSVFAQKLRTTEVSVVLVAQRLSSLNDGFVEQVMRARPIVSRKIELEQLTKEDRCEIFETFLDLPENSDIISEIVKKSDGYTFSEIEKLAVSINVECAIKGVKYITEIEVEKAFECFVAGKMGKIEDGQV